jgi:hypothetical protein
VVVIHRYSRASKATTRISRHRSQIAKHGQTMAGAVSPPSPRHYQPTLLDERLRDAGNGTRHETKVAGSRKQSSDGFELRWEVTLSTSSVKWNAKTEDEHSATCLSPAVI